MDKFICVLYRGSQLLHLLDAYALQYTQMLEGCSEHLPVTELAGGARIRHIFRNIFKNLGSTDNTMIFFFQKSSFVDFTDFIDKNIYNLNISILTTINTNEF